MCTVREPGSSSRLLVGGSIYLVIWGRGFLPLNYTLLNEIIFSDTSLRVDHLLGLFMQCAVVR